MRIDRLTSKSTEALSQAREVAASKNHGEVRPLHLLSALLDQSEGLVPSLIRKLNVDIGELQSSVNHALSTLPEVHGASMDIGVSQALKKLWDRAAKEADSFKDDYISVEHFCWR